MPITEQLQTSEQLERAGLPRAAAVLLAEKFEATAQATHDTVLDRFRSELRSEIAGVRGEIASLRADIAEWKADIEKSIRNSQTVLLSAIGLAVAILAAFRFFH